MATHRSGHRPGGGIASRQVVHRPHGTEPDPHSKTPGRRGRKFGVSYRDHITNKSAKTLIRSIGAIGADLVMSGMGQYAVVRLSQARAGASQSNMAWLKQRCYDPKQKSYRCYDEGGITVRTRNLR